MTTSGSRSADITEKPVKNLGRWYRADLNNQAHVRGLLNQAEEKLKAPERSGLPSKWRPGATNTASFQGSCGRCLRASFP